MNSFYHERLVNDQFYVKIFIIEVYTVSLTVHKRIQIVYINLELYT